MRLIAGLSPLLPAFIAAFVAAALISFLLTPIVRGLALRLNVVDEPNHRRVNTRTIARGGGLHGRSLARCPRHSREVPFSRRPQ